MDPLDDLDFNDPEDDKEDLIMRRLSNASGHSSGHSDPPPAAADDDFTSFQEMASSVPMNELVSSPRASSFHEYPPNNLRPPSVTINNHENEAACNGFHDTPTSLSAFKTPMVTPVGGIGLSLETHNTQNSPSQSQSQSQSHQSPQPLSPSSPSVSHNTPNFITPKDFQLLCVIGMGSFGKVLQVRYKQSGKVAAMKIISKRLLKKKDFIENINAERSIMTKVNHPFIVKMHCSFQTSGKLFLIMDFLAGGEVFFHLGKQGILVEGSERRGGGGLWTTGIRATTNSLKTSQFVWLAWFARRRARLRFTSGKLCWRWVTSTATR